MINVIRQPELYDTTGNGLAFEIEGTDLYEQQGNFASIILSKADDESIRSGDKFILKNFDTGNDLVITAVGNPTNPNEITATASMSEIISDLNSVAEFNKYYEAIAVSGSETFTHYMKIQTREKVDYDWSGFVKPFSMNIESQVTGIAEVLRADYSIYAKLYQLNADDTTVDIAEFDLDVNENNSTVFKPGSILENYIELKKPNLSADTAIEIELFKYRVQFAEKYRTGEDLNIYNSVIIDKYCVKGKIPFNEFPSGGFLSFTNAKNALNKIDYPIYIFEDAEFYISAFINVRNGVEIFAKIFYDDRTTAEQVVQTNYFAFGNIIMFPTSIKKLKLDEIKPGTIYKYMLVARDKAFTGIEITKWMTFIVVDKPLYMRQFAFQNSLGVLEFFYTKGKQTKKITTKKAQYKKEMPIGYKADDAEIIQFTENAYNNFEVSTGSISRKEAENLQQIFNTEIFYEIINGKYVRCNVTTGSTKIIDEDKDLVELKFAYRYAFDL